MRQVGCRSLARRAASHGHRPPPTRAVRRRATCACAQPFASVPGAHSTPCIAPPQLGSSSAHCAPSSHRLLLTHTQPLRGRAAGTRASPPPPLESEVPAPPVPAAPRSRGLGGAGLLCCALWAAPERGWRAWGGVVNTPGSRRARVWLQSRAPCQPKIGGRGGGRGGSVARWRGKGKHRNAPRVVVGWPPGVGLGVGVGGDELGSGQGLSELRVQLRVRAWRAARPPPLQLGSASVAAAGTP